MPVLPECHFRILPARKRLACFQYLHANPCECWKGPHSKRTLQEYCPSGWAQHKLQNWHADSVSELFGESCGGQYSPKSWKQILRFPSCSKVLYWWRRRADRMGLRHFYVSGAARGWHARVLAELFAPSLSEATDITCCHCCFHRYGWR